MQTLCFSQESTDTEVEALYEKMHPEPINSWTDVLVLPDGSEDSFRKTPFHYILFTDDEVTALHYTLVAISLKMGDCPSSLLPSVISMHMLLMS